MLLSNNNFLTQFKALLESQSSSGSVFITQKRFTYQDPSSSSSINDPSTSTSQREREYPCIIKATNGKSHSNGVKKIKISTLVSPEDHPSFTLSYGTLLKTHFSQTMRKKQKDRKRKLASAATAGGGGSAVDGKAKKSAAGATVQQPNKRVRSAGGLPKVIGPRRGAGHANRQRLWNARVRAAKKVLDGRRRRETASKPLFDLQQKRLEEQEQ